VIARAFRIRGNGIASALVARASRMWISASRPDGLLWGNGLRPVCPQKSPRLRAALANTRDVCSTRKPRTCPSNTGIAIFAWP